MIVSETALPGAYLLDVERIEDERGFFARVWCVDELGAHGLDTTLVQASIAFNARRDTLRGLHFQEEPDAETKLVRCTRGAIQDVIVDVRPDSPTYTRWIAVELTAENHRTLYVPKGFAHGYQTLVDDTEVWYGMSTRYAPASARGIRFDDPVLAVEWPPAAARIVSERDRSWPDFVPAQRASRS